MLWTPVQVSAADITLDGDLATAAPGRRHVVFAHGSGSSRRSPRNRAVAERLVDAGLGVLLFDLLTDTESTDRRLVFDIPLLAERLVSATTWLTGQEQVDAEPGSVGYFGASTGAGAALWAATDPQVADVVGAVVSRGGRPDLAGPRLGAVTAPTLLIVGGEDREVLALNSRARALMRCPTDLVVIPGATHLFSEPGALERVAELATDWFLQ